MADGREWKFQKDVSIAGPDSQKCEMVTPILTYEDMETLQELVRILRKAGARSDATRGCGVHIHIGAKGHTPQTLRNLANIMASHESLIAEALDLDHGRMNRYCKTVDPKFLEVLNKKKPDTMAGFADIWYTTQNAEYGRSQHYNSSRYHKGIAKTIRNNADEFFSLHNGITAICSSMSLHENILSVKELNVVNGCQSLSTIYNCSESAKTASDAFIMFRFYEISDTERGDDISTSTNSQSAVKARDLRSNDKYVLSMKKAYEQMFPDGYFITKRGEKADPAKYNTNHIVDLTLLGKWLIAWHSQRPTMSYSENRVFDVYFNQLFQHDYAPEDIQALNEIYKAVVPCWDSANAHSINEALLAIKAYGTFHQMYAISVLFCELNKMQDLVPKPSVVVERLKANSLMDTVVDLSIQCLNIAFDTAYEDATSNGKVFSAQNWSKSKASLKDTRGQIKQYLLSMRMMPGGKAVLENLTQSLQMPKEAFEPRWSAD